MLRHLHSRMVAVRHVVSEQTAHTLDPRKSTAEHIESRVFELFNAPCAPQFLDYFTRSLFRRNCMMTSAEAFGESRVVSIVISGLAGIS